MEIHITQNGQSLGPYSLEEANQKLTDGTLSPLDLAWYEGIAEWVPLSTVPGIKATGPSLPPLPPPLPSPQSTPGEKYTDYKQVPWYRKSSANSIFILLGFLSCGWIPGIIAVCILVATGDIYLNARDDAGNLKKWGKGNKVVAFFFLAINLGLIIYGIMASSSG